MAGFLEPDLIDPASRDAGPEQPIGLAASRCVSCGRVDFPARSACSACTSDVEPATLGGRPRLGPRTAVLHAPPGALVDVPYQVGVAEFDEGLSVLGLVVGDEAATRGDTVEVVSVSVGDRLTYGFRRTTASRG